MSSKPRTGKPKSVFAHFILGNAANYTTTEWILDISEAQAAGIDGFMLNMGVTDPCNGTQLAMAYSTAEQLGYKLAISFDYLAPGPWQVSSVIAIIKQYCDSPAQFRYDGLPLVSTFEGASNAADWAEIGATVPIFFVPTWTSVGPFSPSFQYADGAFSWDVWPLGAADKTVAADKAWKSGMGDKIYMMGVSPWFYTNLPRYQKNWLWRGDDLWHYRWEQILALQPQLVQIITWNDYGESHYIGAVHNSGMPGISPEDPKGARRYVDGMPHDRWRDLLPYYIEAYKTSSRPAILSDKLHYWYRLSPADAGSCKGTVGNAPWEPHANANNVVQDRVFFTALLKAAAVITIQIGSHPAERFRADIPGPFHSSIPFGGRIGAVQVKIIRENAVVGFGMGARIIASPVDDVTNFNAWVGGLDETK